MASLLASDVAHEHLDKTAKQLYGYPDIKWISTTTGRFKQQPCVPSASTREKVGFLWSGQLENGSPYYQRCP